MFVCIVECIFASNSYFDAFLTGARADQSLLADLICERLVFSCATNASDATNVASCATGQRRSQAAAAAAAGAAVPKVKAKAKNQDAQAQLQHQQPPTQHCNSDQVRAQTNNPNSNANPTSASNNNNNNADKRKTIEAITSSVTLHWFISLFHQAVPTMVSS